MTASLFISDLPSTAKPYNAEFYFDTPNPVRIQKGNNYSYNLQWTQRDPEATDRIIGYWLNVRKVRLRCSDCSDVLYIHDIDHLRIYCSRLQI